MNESPRKRVIGTQRQVSAEEQALTEIAKEAESRLAARRAARAEARDIRTREMERQQKETEEKQQEIQSLSRLPSITSSSRSKDSVDGGPALGLSDDARELKREISDLHDKYKKAMLNNAQLDNEKMTLRYQLESLKDRLDDFEEAQQELQREHRKLNQDGEVRKRELKLLQTESSQLKEQITERDKLIQEYGLVLVTATDVPDPKSKTKSAPRGLLVTPEVARILEQMEGSLDDKLLKLAQEKDNLEVEVKKLQRQLDEEKEQRQTAEKMASTRAAKAAHTSNGSVEIENATEELSKQLTDCRFKLKKAEQDITTLDGNVIRLESQVKRYKTASETAEKNEEELKAEKRKLQRELREVQSELEDVRSQNQNLQKRLEKSRTSRSGSLLPS